MRENGITVDELVDNYKNNTGKEPDEQLKNDLKTIGIVEQICELEVMDRESGVCINKNKTCEDCEYYSEHWNTKALINGLEWILKDDKFGFGENWNKGSKPQCEEENAGYIISRVIEKLVEMYHAEMGEKNEE